MTSPANVATTMTTTASHVTTDPSHPNLTPLMILVAVSGVILFCCVCLTGFNSYMRRWQRREQSSISYGEAAQENKRFGSLLIARIPCCLSSDKEEEIQSQGVAYRSTDLGETLRLLDNRRDVDDVRENSVSNANIQDYESGEEEYGEKVLYDYTTTNER